MEIVLNAEICRKADKLDRIDQMLESLTDAINKGDANALKRAKLLQEKRKLFYPSSKTEAIAIGQLRCADDN